MLTSVAACGADRRRGACPGLYLKKSFFKRKACNCKGLRSLKKVFKKKFEKSVDILQAPCYDESVKRTRTQRKAAGTAGKVRKK